MEIGLWCGFNEEQSLFVSTKFDLKMEIVLFYMDE